MKCQLASSSHIPFVVLSQPLILFVSILFSLHVLLPFRTRWRAWFILSLFLLYVEILRSNVEIRWIQSNIHGTSFIHWWLPVSDHTSVISASHSHPQSTISHLRLLFFTQSIRRMTEIIWLIEWQKGLNKFIDSEIRQVVDQTFPIQSALIKRIASLSLKIFD